MDKYESLALNAFLTTAYEFAINYCYGDPSSFINCLNDNNFSYEVIRNVSGNGFIIRVFVDSDNAMEFEFNGIYEFK